MDLMANNNWERPMYFVITVSSDTYQNLDKFFQVEGLTYRIVPIEARRVSGRYGNVESKIMYNNLMNVYRWRSIADPNVYINENSARIISNYRNIFGRLALQLIEENKMDKAIEVVDKCMEVIPPENVPFNFFALTLIESYYRAGAIDKGVEYSKQYMTQCAEELDYFLRLPDSYVSNIRNETELSLYILQELYSMAKTYEKGEHKAELEELFNTIGGKM